MYCNPQGKILWHIDRLNDFDRTGTTRPLLFEIDPSNKCNHNCPWCAFSKLRSESREMLPKQMMVDLVYGLKELGVKAINWTGGGEPLMNEKLADVIFHAKNAGLDQGIFTNGLLMNPKFGKFASQRMTWIRVSLDAYDAKSYAKSHGTSEKAWDVVLNNIRAVTAINKKYRCTLGVGFVINEHNFEGMAEAVRLARELKADYIQFKPVAHRPGEEQIGTEIVRRYYDKALQLEDEFVMVTHYRFQDMMKENRGRNYKRCLSHHFQGAVGADGLVYICDHHKGEKDYVLGDLHKNSIQEIWKSFERTKAINFLDSTDLSQCQDCCRNHELNKTLWHIANKDKNLHPNHI